MLYKTRQDSYSLLSWLAAALLRAITKDDLCVLLSHCSGESTVKMSVSWSDWFNFPLDCHLSVCNHFQKYRHSLLLDTGGYFDRHSCDLDSVCASNWWTKTLLGLCRVSDRRMEKLHTTLSRAIFNQTRLPLRRLFQTSEPPLGLIASWRQSKARVCSGTCTTVQG